MRYSPRGKTTTNKRKKPPKNASGDQELFFQLLSNVGVERPETEVRFHPSRRWRFDYAWPRVQIALEVEGGVWTGGRHSRGSGFVKDMEKYNEAAVRGWLLIRCTPSTLCDNETIELIRRAFQERTDASSQEESKD